MTALEDDGTITKIMTEFAAKMVDTDRASAPNALHFQTNDPSRIRAGLLTGDMTDEHGELKQDYCCGLVSLWSGSLIVFDFCLTCYDFQFFQ